MRQKHRELTAGEITASAIQELEWRGWEVWRQNNLAVRGRNFTGRKGQSDIIGFNKHTGLFLACEVKKKGDVLSSDQHSFLKAVKQSGGIALIARDNGFMGVILTEYNPIVD